MMEEERWVKCNQGLEGAGCRPQPKGHRDGCRMVQIAFGQHMAGAFWRKAPLLTESRGTCSDASLLYR